MHHRFFEEDDHCDTDKCDQRCDRTDVQRNQLAGDRCTDIGTHDDPDLSLIHISSRKQSEEKESLWERVHHRLFSQKK